MLCCIGVNGVVVCIFFCFFSVVGGYFMYIFDFLINGFEVLEIVFVEGCVFKIRVYVIWFYVL